MNGQEIESMLRGIGMGFVSIVSVIAFLFISGTIWVMIEKRSINVFDDIDHIIANGAIVFLTIAGTFCAMVILWAIGFLVSGGTIGI